MMLRETLQKAGYEVDSAADGLQGLDSLRNQPVDLIITDLIMPEKEGLETIMDLRREFPAVPIVAVSGGGRSGPESNLEMARRLGARSSFQKPLDMKSFLASVGELLGENGRLK